MNNPNNTKFALSYAPEHTKYVFGVRVNRVIALREIRHGVKKGTVGGFVASEKCLSFHGRSWVADDACVLPGCRVEDDARASGNALLINEAILQDKAEAFDAATVDNSTLAGNATIFGIARICRVYAGGSAFICGKANVAGRENEWLQIDPHAVLRDERPITSPKQYTVVIGMQGEVITIDKRSKLYYIGSWAGYENQYFERLKSRLTRDFHSYQKLLRENAALYGNLKPYVMEDSLTRGGL